MKVKNHQIFALIFATLLFSSVSTKLQFSQKNVPLKDRTPNGDIILKTNEGGNGLKDYPSIDECKAYNLTMVIKKSSKQTPFNISTFGSWSGCGTDGRNFQMKTQLGDTPCQQTLSGVTFGQSGRIVTANCLIQGPFPETGFIRQKNYGWVKLDGAGTKNCTGDVTFEIVDDAQFRE